MSPISLTEAIKTVADALTPDRRAEIRYMSEDELVGLHFSLGQWVRNRIVYQENGLMERVNAVAPFAHPDEISSLIVEAVWLDVRGLSINVPDLARRHLFNDSADVVAALAAVGTS